MMSCKQILTLQIVILMELMTVDIYCVSLSFARRGQIANSAVPLSEF